VTCEIEKGLIMEFLDSGTPKEIRTSLGIYVDWLEEQGRIEAIPMKWVWEYIQVPPRVGFYFMDDRGCMDSGEWEDNISPTTVLFGTAIRGPYRDFKLLPREDSILSEIIGMSQKAFKRESGGYGWNCIWSPRSENEYRYPWDRVSGGPALFDYDIWDEDRTDQFSLSLKEVEEVVRNAQ